LNAWSWFWVFEGIFYFGFGALIAWWLGATFLIEVFVSIAIAYFLLACFQRARLPGYAKPQIESIAADATSRYDVKNKFDAV
jgi:hypothetical protein